jgi:hypothetical protein
MYVCMYACICMYACMHVCMYDLSFEFQQDWPILESTSAKIIDSGNDAGHILFYFISKLIGNHEEPKDLGFKTFPPTAVENDKHCEAHRVPQGIAEERPGCAQSNWVVKSKFTRFTFESVGDVSRLRRLGTFTASVERRDMPTGGGGAPPCALTIPQRWHNIRQ